MHEITYNLSWLLQLSVKLLQHFFLKVVYFLGFFLKYISYFPAQKHRKHIKVQQINAYQFCHPYQLLKHQFQAYLPFSIKVIGVIGEKK